MDEQMEMKTQAADEVKEENDIIITSGWTDEHEEEIKTATFARARDTVKPGDSLDFLSCFCGVFAVACFAIVLVFGIKNGFSDAMIFLMVTYVLIAVFSLCHPLQVKISRAIWSVGFKKRIAENKSYDKKIIIQIKPEGDGEQEEFVVKVLSPEKEEEYGKKDCSFYETNNYIILHVTDKKLYPIEKESLKEETASLLLGFCTE